MNIYWPVFKNLETEFIKLMYYIHIDDEQILVYSSKISDLILRAAIEIESISKELYIKNGGTKTGMIKYDSDAIEYLINEWKLDKKVVIISSILCFQSVKTLYPFSKNYQRKNGSYTFSWNLAYQNIKHDRGKSLSDGSIKNLFDILSALYLLNLYYTDKLFELGKDSAGASLSPNLGSDIFAINISKGGLQESEGGYKKAIDFEESVYYVITTDKSEATYKNSVLKFSETMNQMALKIPKVIDYLSKNDPAILKPGWLVDAIGFEAYKSLLQVAMSQSPIAVDQLKYEARLNKNN